jgi:zinc protease
MKSFIISLLLAGALFAQEVVELKMPNSNKIIIKLMFRNGSICDPKGKEGLTFATTNSVSHGGTKDLSYNQIQD